MEIIKCPHKNQKHYAKVTFKIFNIILSRVCAITVTISMEGTVMLMLAPIQID
jgi:hypothetical protein